MRAKRIASVTMPGLIVLTLLCGLPAPASADVIVIVPGTSDPWLAGMPNGSTASAGGGGFDIAPTHSPVEVLGLPFGAGDLLFFSATGTVDHCDFGGCGLNGPEGEASSNSHSAGVQNGIGDVLAPTDSLIGIFLGPMAPNLTPDPGAVLDFSSVAARNFSTLSPLLEQPFFIGDGLMNDGLTVQLFDVPTGATRLFLGTMDGFGWFNNVGAFEVTVGVEDDVTAVPEPATLTLLGVGLGIAARARRRSKR